MKDLRFAKIVSVSLKTDDDDDVEVKAMGYWPADAASIRFPILKDLEYTGTHIIHNRYGLSIRDAYALLMRSGFPFWDIVRLQGQPRSVFLTGIKNKIKNDLPLDTSEKIYAYFFPDDIDQTKHFI